MSSLAAKRIRRHSQIEHEELEVGAGAGWVEVGIGTHMVQIPVN